MNRRTPIRVVPALKDNVTIRFPRSRVLAFMRAHISGMNIGRTFYKFMELDKITNPNDKAYCDRLYNATTSDAHKMIIARTDWRK